MPSATAAVLARDPIRRHKVLTIATGTRTCKVVAEETVVDREGVADKEAGNSPTNIGHVVIKRTILDRGPEDAVERHAPTTLRTIFGEDTIGDVQDGLTPAIHPSAFSSGGVVCYDVNTPCRKC